MFRKMSFGKINWTPRMQGFFSTSIQQHPNFVWASQQWRQTALHHRIWLAQFDVAGTLLDEFCIAPFHAFAQLFSKRGFTLSPSQITGPMGLKKIEHIKHLLEEIREEWREKYGKYPQSEDAVYLNEEFNLLLQESLPLYTGLTPKADLALDFVSQHLQGFALTTGYPRFAADIATSQLIKRYPPNAITTSDEVVDGTRFAMVEENNRKLNLKPEQVKHTAFFTDAGSDVASLRRAKEYPWILGISGASTHNEITSLKEARNMSPEVRLAKRTKAMNILYEQGAHCVITDLSELPLALIGMNKQLQQGLSPNEVRRFTLPSLPSEVAAYRP